jgi:hypothetical protein
MSADEVMRLAIQAGFDSPLSSDFWADDGSNKLQAFADLIAAREREALSVFFEGHWRDRWTDEEVAAAIRARTTGDKLSPTGGTT